MRIIRWMLPSVLVSGCFYSFTTSLPGHVETVNIPVFQNETLEVDLAEQLTTAVTERFIQDNLLNVIQGAADSELNGSVTGYEERVFGFDSQQRADEYLVVVTVDLLFRDRVKNKEIWSEESVRGVGSYFLGSSETGVPTTETEARGLAIKQIVDIIVSRTFEGW
jgi:hypothetical protein